MKPYRAPPMTLGASAMNDILIGERNGGVVSEKAALRNFTRTLASELISRNIRVNAVNPG